MFKKNKKTKKSLLNLQLPDCYKDIDFKSYICMKHSNWYKKDEIVFISKVILFNLLRRRFFKNTKYRSVYISRDGHKYVFGKLHGFGFMPTLNAVKILRELGIVVEFKGNRNEKLTTYLKLCNFEDWKYHKIGLSLMEMSAICYENESSSKKESVFRTKISKSRKIDIIIEKEHPIVKQVNKFNEALLKKDNDLTKNWKYYRIFGENDTEYGRFYSNFQRKPKVVRNRWCKSRNLVEIDFKNMNPRILHALETDENFDGDFYNDYLDACQLPHDLRPLAKKIFMVALGTSSRDIAEKAIRHTLAYDMGVYSSKIKQYKVIDFNELDDRNRLTYWIWKKKNKIDYNLSAFLTNEIYLLDKLEKAFPKLNKYFYTNIHSVVQNIESSIICNLMEEMLNDDILPLTIHDCMIVPERLKSKYDALSEKVFMSEIKKYKLKNNSLY